MQRSKTKTVDIHVNWVLNMMLKRSFGKYESKDVLIMCGVMWDIVVIPASIKRCMINVNQLVMRLMCGWSCPETGCVWMYGTLYVDLWILDLWMLLYVDDWMCRSLFVWALRALNHAWLKPSHVKTTIYTWVQRHLGCFKPCLVQASYGINHIQNFKNWQLECFRPMLGLSLPQSQFTTGDYNETACLQEA